MRAVVAVVLFLSLATCGSAACTQAISIVTKDGWDAKDASIYTEPAFETLQVGDTYTSYTTFTVGDKTVGYSLTFNQSWNSVGILVLFVCPRP